MSQTRPAESNCPSALQSPGTPGIADGRGPKMRRRGPVIRRRKQEGQALIEFALVLPVLLLLLLAILKLGLLFNNYLTLTDAVRAGARQLALGRGIGAGPPTACALATTQVNNSAGSLKVANLTVTETESGLDTCTSLTQGNAATVTGKYPCDLTILGINFVPGCQLNVSATERVE